MYMADAEKNHDVVSIASVSGGSITNGFIAQECAFSKCTADQFRGIASRLATRIATRGTVYSSKWMRFYLAALLVSLVGIAGIWMVPLPRAVRLFTMGVAVLAWIWKGWSSRGVVAARALADTILSKDRHETLLREVSKIPEHVFCATEIHAGEHVYFSAGFVGSYRLGWGEPADLLLCDVVQASASFPVGFPPRRFPTTRHRFANGRVVSRDMLLLDGGLYDNMADQWARSSFKRPEADGGSPGVDELIVVNASVGRQWESISRVLWPVIGEAFSLLETIDILYDNTTAQRRKTMVDDFDRADRQGAGMRGAILTIEQSPWKIPEFYAAHARAWPERATRGRHVLEFLQSEDRAAWEQLVATNCSVPTSLRRVATPFAAMLIRHGYTVAMCNLHTLLDYPILAIPSPERCELICSAHS
jgi:predicted acylesterase/phospholipase RssA